VPVEVVPAILMVPALPGLPAAAQFSMPSPLAQPTIAKVAIDAPSRITLIFLFMAKSSSRENES
jgi:hypothetical protein